ncbi:sensor histidine kinase [Streptomyces roseirectus]|uniref:histidine kinase n=1 Tax=Streptomyces roseirectus TaxID=2768066 RepID=A0A7H0I7B2_9ACTN|nr:histidine kinase [Streptomyces roseirectus]QNP68678.1 sensor histidine kinase [Streptomyces roseirectus]
MKSVSSRGLARGFADGLLVSACAVDVLLVGFDGEGDLPVAPAVWPALAVVLTGLAAVLWPSGRRPDWLTLRVRILVPVLASVLYSLGSAISVSGTMFGPGEVVLLLCLLHIAVRRCPARSAVGYGVLAVGALMLLPVRSMELPGSDALVLGFIGLVLIGLFVALAAYLRTMDYRRAVAVSETRRGERVAIAADLHDFVAHHVTGILVQTQVARMMATTQRHSLDPVLAGMEHAATEALASMRRTVGVLRDTGDDAADHRPAADRRPVGDLAAIADLTDRFATPIQTVTLHRAPTLSDRLPHEIQAAAFRVVQESLTNIRRHAGDATHIDVHLHNTPHHLVVSITDNGRGSTQLPPEAHGGGFGLIGLKERVTALGGALHTGPGRDTGWEVRATFPLPKA